MKIAFPFIGFLLLFFFVSCNKLSPAAFWKNFDSQYLEEDISGQGPYGGHRAMHWKNQKPNAFSSDEVLAFAKKNGWTLVDSSKFNGEQTSRWTYNGKPVFPLTSAGFSDANLNDNQLADFPRWFGGEVSMYKFKTGWVTIKPGTDDSIEQNGFVVINNSKTEMAVYHLWGE